MIPGNNDFYSEVKSFVNSNKILCAVTLGLAVAVYALGNLAGRAVSRIAECAGTTKKTDTVAQKSFDTIPSRHETQSDIPMSKDIEPSPKAKTDLPIILQSDKSQSSFKIIEVADNPLANSADEARIRQELQKRGIIKDRIDSIVSIIKEIVLVSTVFGQPVTYDEQGMAYLRKSEQIPFTLQVYTNGTERHVYIHLKSKTTGQYDLIGEACQKAVYRALNQSGEVFAASVIHEQFKENNPVTFETEKTALEIFKGCSYILQGFHASCYPHKDPDKGVKYGLITEYCEGPADKSFLNGLSLKERWTFFLHTLEGVKAMHDGGYCHFDLKSDNILRKTVGNVSEPRIIDFGVMHPMGEVLTSGARGAYLPPENEIHENYPITVTEKVDVWALGQYAAMEFLGVYPNIKYDYMVDKDGNYAGKKGRLEVDWSQVPIEMQPFVPIIQQMLNCDPNERISMDSAIKQIGVQLQKIP